MPSGRAPSVIAKVLANAMMMQWPQAIGSRSLFSTMTIDQSAKWINVERLGAWAGGRTPMRDADVLMMVGTNPLVSLSTFNFVNQSPVKSIKDAKAAGRSRTIVQPGHSDDRFTVAPDDIVTEMGELARKAAISDAVRPFRFAVRRMREVQNSMYHHLPSIRRRVPDNPAWLQPEDMTALGLVDEDRVLIESAYGAIRARVQGDVTMRRGVVAMAHGWGDDGVGVNVNILTSRTVDRDPINAMPVMTRFAVSISKI